MVWIKLLLHTQEAEANASHFTQQTVTKEVKIGWEGKEKEEGRGGKTKMEREVSKQKGKQLDP